MHRRRFWLGIVLLLAALILGACELDTDDNTGADAPGAPALTGGEIATVTRIIDGDTIDVRINGETFRVRYVGINTPERDEPCYDAATQANADLVQGRTVTLVRDVSNTDRYDRLLRYIYVGDTFVNAALVAGGWAEAGYYPPDTAHLDEFNALESDARRAGLGCHPTGVFD